MSAFQAVVYSIIHSFSLFLPISHSAHEWFVPFLFQWPAPSPAFQGILMLGSTLALLIHFRHDWASIISSGLRVVLLWKKPMTLDERMPFFILLSALPSGVVWFYFEDFFQNRGISPYWIAVNLVIFGLPLLLADYMNRRTKNMFNWNWLDSLITGLAQILMFIPGAGRQVGVLTGALLRNYNRDAAAKFLFFSFLPILIGKSYLLLAQVDFNSAQPSADLSWLSFWVGFAVSVICGLLAIGGFMKNLNQSGFGGYFLYRCILAAGALGVLFYRGS